MLSYHFCHNKAIIIKNAAIYGLYNYFSNAILNVPIKRNGLF